MATKKQVADLVLPHDAPFATRLWYICKKRGYTQRKAAELCDVTYGTMCNYMGGRCEPAVTILVNIAKGLEVSLDWLCGLRDEV